MSESNSIFVFETIDIEEVERLAGNIMPETETLDRDKKIREIKIKLMEMFSYPENPEEYCKAQSRRPDNDEGLYMGDGEGFFESKNPRRRNPFVGHSAESFSETRAPSKAEKIRSEKFEGITLTEDHICLGLAKIDYIRSVCESPISIKINGISTIDHKSLFATEDGTAYIVRKEDLKQEIPDMNIILGVVNSPDSFIKLNTTMKLSLCNSPDFKEFVKSGFFLISSAAEKEKKVSEWEENLAEKEEKRKQREKALGIYVETEDVFKYALDEIHRQNLELYFYDQVHDLEKIKSEKATISEKLRIASEILLCKQKAALEKKGPREAFSILEKMEDAKEQ